MGLEETTMMRMVSVLKYIVVSSGNISCKTAEKAALIERYG